MYFFFFFQAEDGIRDYKVTGVQTCALPISNPARPGELANFASRGITHVGLGFGTEVRAGRSTTLAFGARSQLNLDDATKADGPGRTRDFVVWLWTGITVVLGDARRGQ